MSKLPVTVLFLSMHGYAFVACQLLKFFLRERILRRIQHSLRLVEIQIFYWYADVLEYFVQSLAEVSESNSTVVREVLLDQYVTIETSHFRNSEYTNCSKGCLLYTSPSPRDTR